MFRLLTFRACFLLWSCLSGPLGLFAQQNDIPLNRDINSPGSRRSQAPLVGNGPGAMALLRMPYFAHSTASERVMASTPAFAQALGTT